MSQCKKNTDIIPYRKTSKSFNFGVTLQKKYIILFDIFKEFCDIHQTSVSSNLTFRFNCKKHNILLLGFDSQAQNPAQHKHIIHG